MFGKNRKQGAPAGKRQSPSLGDMQQADSEREIAELDDKIANVVSSSELGTGNFFCTDDPFITKLDDRQILAYVARREPGITDTPGSPAFKQAVVSFLADGDFVELVMDEFDLSAQDLFKFLFRIDPSVFKGMFMKKVKEIVSGRRYFN